MDSIEPFDYQEITDFSTAYLPGYMADKYDVSAEACSDRADARARQTLSDSLRETVTGYTAVLPKGEDVRLRRGVVKYALLPVWLLYTKWAGQDFLFAMNGQTGKVVGDLPIDKGKRRRNFFTVFLVTLLVALAVAAASLFFVGGGKRVSHDAGARPQAGAQLSFVTDSAGLLTAQEKAGLAARAEEISSKYGVGVYIVTVPDYQKYVSGGDAFDAAKKIYDQAKLGYGSGREGVLLLLSMADRDYCLLANGDYGRYAFSDAGRQKMDDFFLDDFGDDKWSSGFSDYLTWADRYLAAAAEGKPYGSLRAPGSDGLDPMILLGILAAVLLIPLALAGLVVAVRTSRMKSVAAGTEASAYVAGGLQLTERVDQFTFVTHTVRHIEQDHGGSTESSGSASGTVGKF